MDHKKYHLIQTQIQEARQALQNWNDRRAEAAIELDSIFTEIEEAKTQAAAEREAASKTIAELNAKLEKSDREFHQHFEDYTNDMQELKLENETLSRRLKEAVNEIEKQKQSQKKMEEQSRAQMVQMASQAEIRAADQQYQLKTQINNLIAELQSLQNDRQAITVKADQYEKELRVIRNQMMSFLNVTKEVAGTEVSAPIVVSASALNSANTNNRANVASVADVSPADVKTMEQQQAGGATASGSSGSQKKSNKLQPANLIVDNLGTAPTTVNDYLKRFGY